MAPPGRGTAAIVCHGRLLMVWTISRSSQRWIGKSMFMARPVPGLLHGARLKMYRFTYSTGDPRMTWRGAPPTRVLFSHPADTWLPPPALAARHHLVFSFSPPRPP